MPIVARYYASARTNENPGNRAREGEEGSIAVEKKFRRNYLAVLSVVPVREKRKREMHPESKAKHFSNAQKFAAD